MLDKLLEMIGGRLTAAACRVCSAHALRPGRPAGPCCTGRPRWSSVDYGEAIEVEAVCTPVQLGRLKDYIVSGWTPPKEPWED
ncbi:MAG: hypothetical protein ACLRWQ_18930 [Flavonifractor plautii]